MRKLIKLFLLVSLLAAGLKSSFGYSLLGPIGNAGDAWQVTDIGYGLPGDIGAPKNLGEEYRLNVPYIYYAYDASFLDYFGLVGATNVDGAFYILNDITNVSNYTPDLSEFPQISQQINYSAQALNLMDLKSVSLGLLVEHMGLASPDRYAWTLHNRVDAGTCPIGTKYLVVQRNFDAVTSPLNQIQYSPYVNGTLYTYQIVENCTGTPLASTFPSLADPLAQTYSPVASFAGGGVFIGGVLHSVPGLNTGGFYTGLTLDDVAGLRYLLSSNNLNYEATAPAGGQLLLTNKLAAQLLTTLPYGLLLSQASTNDPAALQALYPGLIISSTVTNYLFVNVTNVTAYYTNQPGPSVTNYSPTLQLWANFDLSLFLSQAKTSAPSVLQALYPALLILSSAETGYITVTNPVVVTYLTNNQYGAPYPASPSVVTVTNGYTFDYIKTYFYTFGNILTNTYSTSNKVTIQTISVTNLIGSPHGSPQSINITTVTKYLTNSISGDFFIVPTNWCGYSILATQSVQKVASYTNVLVATGTTNSFGSAQFSQNTIFFYTNRVYSVFPGVCEPALVFATNIGPTVLTNYQESFANILIISRYNNTSAAVITTNIGVCSNQIAGVLCTNVTQTNFLSSAPSGDFIIVPAAWNCGYSIVSTQSVNAVGLTNTITIVVPPNVANNIGQQYSVTTISFYTNRLLVIQPYTCDKADAPPALRQGIEHVQFIRANYDSLLGQYFVPITNNYHMVKVTNSQPVFEYYQRILVAPDITFSAADLVPGPADTLGGHIATRNINFDQSTILTGLAGPGVIGPRTTITLNKGGPVFGNKSPFLMYGPNFIAGVLWGSFDGTTNDPVLYPNGTSIAALQAIALLQVSPATLPTGTNGVAYPNTTFTVVNGLPPYTWAAPNLSVTVPGMSFIGGTNTNLLSGTPTATGTFNFTLQVTDSLNRVVNLSYTLVVQ